MNTDANVVILAGGKGTRMQSELPKVLHPLFGHPMVSHVLDAVSGLSSSPIVVTGYKSDEVRAAVGEHVRCVVQTEQLGTGHAVRCASELLQKTAVQPTLVVYGDMPLITRSTFASLYAAHQSSMGVLTLLTARPPHFSEPYQALERYGRVIRNGDGNVRGIVEYKDATPEQRALHEVNTGVYCFDTGWLVSVLPRLTAHNAAGEYYLTDLVALACAEGLAVRSVVLEDAQEALGANTPEELAMLARYAHSRRDVTLAV